MKTVKFHPDAEAEMTAAAAYYEEKQRGLGDGFWLRSRTQSIASSSIPTCIQSSSLMYAGALPGRFPSVSCSKTAGQDRYDGGYASEPRSELLEKQIDVAG